MIVIRLEKLKNAVRSVRGKSYANRVLDKQIALGGGIHPKTISDINRNPSANITLRTLEGLIRFFFDELKEPKNRKILFKEEITPKEYSERELLNWIIFQLLDVETITNKT